MTQSLWCGDDVLHSLALQQRVLFNNSKNGSSSSSSSSGELSVEEQTSALLQAQRHYREAKVCCTVTEWFHMQPYVCMLKFSVM